MRRIRLISIVLSLAVSLVVSAEDNTNGSVFLYHNGVETYFPASNLQSAFDLAEEGDTVVVGNGNYYNDSGYTVRKKIYITGDNFGTLYVDIPGNPNFTVPLCENISISTIYIKCNCENFLIRNCSGGTLEVKDGFAVNALIDRCTYWTVKVTSECKSFVLRNSYLDRLQGSFDAQNLPTLINCDYNCFGTENIGANYVNCIFKTCMSEAPEEKLRIKYSKLTNCLIMSDHIQVDESSEETNTYSMTKENWDTNTSKLEELGYLGTDGTIIGRYGGETPYGSNNTIKTYPEIWKGNIYINSNVLNMNYYINPRRW